MKRINEYSNMTSADREEKAAKKAINNLYVVMMFGVLCYYVLPFLCMIYFKGVTEIYNYILLYVNTVYSYIACYLHAVKNDFKIYTPLAVGLLFVPSCITFGYISIVMMSVLYLALGFFGAFTGHIVYKRKLNGNKTLLSKYVDRKKQKQQKGGNR